jgi:hypothetical protein
MKVAEHRGDSMEQGIGAKELEKRLASCAAHARIKGLEAIVVVPDVSSRAPLGGWCVSLFTDIRGGPAKESG